MGGARHERGTRSALPHWHDVSRKSRAATQVAQLEHQLRLILRWYSRHAWRERHEYEIDSLHPKMGDLDTRH
ncbi:MAG: hypothetical protein EBU67_11075, partial [Actinobacteria bacterium]|nr:hypothetical protein [Actinomycetota bacterium]